MSEYSSRILSSSSQYLAANVIAQGASLVRAIFVPALLSPGQLGIWNLMNVILNYVGHAHLGLLHGLNRAIPILRGERRLAESEAMKESVFWIVLLLGVLAASCLWTVTWLVPLIYVSGMRVTAITAVLLLLFYYLFSVLRGDNRFELVSAGVAALAIVSTGLVCVLAFVMADRLLGALIGIAAGYGVVLLLWFGRCECRFPLRIDPKLIRQAFVLGAPLAGLGALDIVFQTVDRWVVVVFLGENALGQYALGVMASMLFSAAAGSVSSVLYPLMLERFAVTRDPLSLGKLLGVPLQLLAALITIGLVGGVNLLPVVIRFLLPKYAPAIGIIEILVPSAFFTAIGLVACTYLTVLNKIRLMIGVQVISTALNVAMYGISVWTGAGARGIALSTAFGNALCGLGYTVPAVYWAHARQADAVRYVLRLLAPFCVGILVVLGLGALIPDGETMASAVLAASGRIVLGVGILVTVIWAIDGEGELAAVALQGLRVLRGAWR